MFKIGLVCRYIWRSAYLVGPVDGQVFSTSDREYSVDKLFELSKELPEKEVLVSKFLDQLYDDVWSKGDDDKDKMRPIDITPKSKHWKRMLDSDLDFPIIVGPDNEIMDGYHRLLKAVLLNQKTIKVKEFDSWPKDAEIKNAA